MSVKEALKELPSYNKNNFTKLDVPVKTSKKLPVYVSTKDHKSRTIITEKTNVLLKFLHKNWSKDGKSSNKRENKGESSTPKKKIRVERIDH